MIKLKDLLNEDSKKDALNENGFLAGRFLTHMIQSWGLHPVAGALVIVATYALPIWLLIGGPKALWNSILYQVKRAGMTEDKAKQAAKDMKKIIDSTDDKFIAKVLKDYVAKVEKVLKQAKAKGKNYNPTTTRTNAIGTLNFVEDARGEISQLLLKMNKVIKAHNKRNN